MSVWVGLRTGLDVLERTLLSPFQESNHDSLVVEPVSQLLIVWFLEYIFFFTVRLMQYIVLFCRVFVYPQTLFVLTSYSPSTVQAE